MDQRLISSLSAASHLCVIGAKYIAGIALFLALNTILSDVLAQENPFLEQNGLVVIQAETMGPTGDWVVEDTDAGFTGTGYLRWNGPDYFGTPGNGVIAIPFNVESAGNYVVKLRSSHLGAPAGDQWNDTWMKMNETDTWTKAGHPAANMNEGFTFDMFVEPSGGVFIDPVYYLEAGTHTFFLSGRSFNFRIDRIHIYKEGTPDPENLSHPESPRENEGGGGGGGVFTLTVNDGTGSGVYPVGTRVIVTAAATQNDIPFDRWTGDTSYVEDIFSYQTAVVMPSADITISPTYKSNALRTPEDPVGALPEISYEYYEATWDYLPDFDTLTPVATGSIPTISLSPRQQEEGFLFRYTGFIDAPADGTYTFYTASDDGSQLFIGDLLVVDNDSIQSVQERSGEIGLKAGKHALTVTYFERTGDQALIVSWTGPGIEKQEVPASALFHGGEVPASGTIGDVSLNGTVSALDASMVLSHTIDQVPLGDDAMSAADVSGNGNISAFDASLILQYVVGLIDCFPASSGCISAPSSINSAYIYNLSER